jgi:hypothetical protein
MTTYDVSYKYRKIGSSGYASNSTSVKAETETTAIRLVENKYPGCEVLITSIKTR